MNLISIVGAGLLVGVALVVIIPEGMITLNEALLSKPVAVDDEMVKVLLRETNLTLEQATQMHIPTEHTDVNVSMYLGGSLVFGFLVMLLIDQ
jgi:zinc transporter 9